MNQEEISYLIRLARKGKKISQQELGKMTGISHQIISRYEKGAEVPTKEKLQLILNSLEIDYEKINEYKEEIDDLFNKFLNESFYREANYQEYLENVKNKYKKQ